MPNLSVGSGVIVVFLFTGSPDRVSPLSRPGTRPAIRPVIRDDQPKELAMSRGFVLPFGHRRSLLGHPIPAEGLGPPHGRLTGHVDRTSTGLPRFARPSNDREGCPLYPGDDGAHPGLRTVLSRRLPHLNGTSLHPAPTLHLTGLHIARHQRRFKQFTRPVFPSPAATRMKTSSSLSFPPSFEPRRPEPNDARRGRDRPSSTDLEQRSTISAEPPIERVRS